MSDRPDGKPSKRAAVQVAATAVRDEVRFMVRRIVQPIEAHELSVKAQHNKAARITGIPPRRIKDLWHGYVKSIPATQDRTIRAAYQRWLETAKARALADLQQIEREHANLERDVADYLSSRWRAAVEDRASTGAVCAETPAATKDG
jgi:hypothetical protein